LWVEVQLTELGLKLIARSTVETALANDKCPNVAYGEWEQHSSGIHRSLAVLPSQGYILDRH
jgi:hypothetical protein